MVCNVGHRVGDGNGWRHVGGAYIDCAGEAVNRAGIGKTAGGSECMGESRRAAIYGRSPYTATTYRVVIEGTTWPGPGYLVVDRYVRCGGEERKVHNAYIGRGGGTGKGTAKTGQICRRDGGQKSF